MNLDETVSVIKCIIFFYNVVRIVDLECKYRVNTDNLTMYLW